MKCFKVFKNYFKSNMEDSPEHMISISGLEQTFWMRNGLRILKSFLQKLCTHHFCLAFHNLKISLRSKKTSNVSTRLCSRSFDSHV